MFNDFDHQGAHSQSCQNLALFVFVSAAVSLTGLCQVIGDDFMLSKLQNKNRPSGVYRPICENAILACSHLVLSFLTNFTKPKIFLMDRQLCKKKRFDHLSQPQLILEWSKVWSKIGSILLRFCISATELSRGSAKVFLDFSDIVETHEV